MLKVVILEDNKEQRNDFKSIVDYHIQFNSTTKKYDMELSVVTDNPQDIMDYLKNHPHDPIFAVLDIEITGQTLTGIDVAEAIRTSQPFASIVFITTHDEMMQMTLQRRVEPLDFIYKEQGNDARDIMLKKDVDVAYERYQRNMLVSEDSFIYPAMRGIFREVKFSDLCYIESITGGSHQLMLTGKNISAEFKGNLQKILEKYSNLMRCDRGTIINPQNIFEFDKNGRFIYFDKEKKIRCSVSARNVKTIRDYLIGLSR